MHSIATLDSFSSALGTAAKFFALLRNGGVSMEDVRAPIDNAAKRRNLITFMKAGCPKFTLVGGEATTAIKCVLPKGGTNSIDVAEWEHFYAQHFGLTGINLSGIHVPPKPEYQCRAIVMVPQITNNQAFDACTKSFKTWRYMDDLDAIRDIVNRPRGPYVVWVHDTVEGDPEMANKSARDIEAGSVNTLILKERLLGELKYFEETGKHLDIENWTLCAGSRDPDGYVPSVHWDD